MTTVSPIGLLRFHGPDAGKFLQGQLSNDMSALSNDRLMLAGFHNPQGRVLALLHLAALASDHIVALLPAELAAATMTTLRRYVLRAKVTISDDSSPAVLAELAAQLPCTASMLSAATRADDIAAGLPQVYAASSGEFVAQMLNLDCIGAISFDKGCYTGQEIIARAHYRGRMKRRMQRFVSNGPAALTPGQSITLGDGRSAQVVDAVTLADGRAEFLAVAVLEAGPTAAMADIAAAASLAVTPLPLPYALPE